MLGKLSGARNVLELGAFTGYSALCFAEAVASNNAVKQNIDTTTGVVTCEIDPRAADVAQQAFDSSEYSNLV